MFFLTIILEFFSLGVDGCHGLHRVLLMYPLNPKIILSTLNQLFKDLLIVFY